MIIAIANQKGGVAKTTSTICLSGLLAPDGCLAIDLDPQGNLTTGLGVDLADDQLTAYHLITERATALQTIVSTDSKVSIIPADITLAKGEPEIISKVGNFSLLREALDKKIRKQYPYILIDCPPSLGLLTINALAAADYILIPCQCQFFALKGLAALLETIETVQKRLNPNLKVLGVLPTMAEKTVMTQDIVASLRNDLPGITVFDPVPKSVQFSEANVAGKAIHDYSRDPKLAAPYKSVVSFIKK
jgi:chromosome partitioning protein